MVARARVPAGPLRDLKDLLYRLYLDSGPLTLDEIAKRVAADDELPGAPQRDTIQRCLSAPAVPASQHDVAAVTAILARASGWDEADAVTRARDLWVRARLATPPGWAISTVSDPFALEIHPAIDAGAAAAGLPELPPYVERSHDEQLGRLVRRAMDGTSGIAVLIGDSSTGKTRACWEAIRHLGAAWRLWHPIDPSRPEAAAVGLPAVGPHTVLWLNETQHYLRPADPVLGERIAAGLRELLRDRDRGPVLVLGTLWRQEWDRLTRPPAADGQDPHAQARTLLVGVGIEIPTSFTGSALKAVRDSADPRLVEAAGRAEDGRITQYLAGGPAVIDRYRVAGDAARAVLDAAVDARRLGHGVALPKGLLVVGASGYLTDQQWDELPADWLARAFDYTAAPTRGARPPLARIRPRPDQPEPVEPQYRLSDYLEQTEGARRAATPVPAVMWDALLAHAARTDLARLATQARRRGMYRLAFRFTLAAADAGYGPALRSVITQLVDGGRTEEAIDWLRSRPSSSLGMRLAGDLLRFGGRSIEAADCLRLAAEAGDGEAILALAGLLEATNQVEEAIGWYQRAAGLGDAVAMLMVIDRFESTGREVEAAAWLRSQAATGNRHAMRLMADRFAANGSVDSALHWFERAAGAGDLDAWIEGAGLLEEAGRFEEATWWLMQAVENNTTQYVGRAYGDSSSQRYQLMREIIGMLGVERRDEAVAWLQTLADNGDRLARTLATWELESARRFEQALAWNTIGAENGDVDAMVHVAQLLRRTDRIDEAISWYRRAIDAGDVFLMIDAVELLERQGRLDEAITWLQARAEYGDLDALQYSSELLEESGRAPIAWLCQRAAEGSRIAAWCAVEILERQGQTSAAIDVLIPLAEAGDDTAIKAVTEGLIRFGEPRKAIELYRHCITRGSVTAYEGITQLALSTGMVTDAVDWLTQRAVDSSDHEAARWVAKLLDRAGRSDAAVEWLRARADSSDPVLIAYLADLVARAGHVDEAVAWYKRAAECGHQHCLENAAEVLNRAHRADEAKHLLRYGIEPGAGTACAWQPHLEFNKGHFG